MDFSKENKKISNAQAPLNLSEQNVKDLEKAFTNNTQQLKDEKQKEFTINDIRQILEWLLARAKHQYSIKTSDKQNKKEYFDLVKNLLRELQEIQKSKTLTDNDKISSEDIISMYKELGFGREYGKRNIKPRRPPRDGDQGYDAGGEESGRERSPLLNKPFSGSNYLQIENLLIAYNLQDEFPSLMRGTPTILMDFFYNRRSKAITDGRPDNVTEKNYLIYLQHAIDKIQKRYIESENAKQREPNNSDIKIAEHLKRLIGEMARQL